MVIPSKTLAHFAIGRRRWCRRGDQDVIARRHATCRNLLLQVLHRFDHGHTRHDRSATARLTYRVRTVVGIAGHHFDVRQRHVQGFGSDHAHGGLGAGTNIGHPDEQGVSPAGIDLHNSAAHA
jgi:hypothetical protein